MLRQSKAAQERNNQYLVDTYVTNGAIDHDAVKQAAVKQADKFWPNGNVVYKSYEDMVNGFYASMVKDIESAM